MKSDFLSKKSISVIVIVILGIVLASYLVLLETETASSGTDIGDKAPNFTLMSVGGENFSLRDYEGKVVILTFFSVNCPACKGETIALKRIRSFYTKGEVGMISIDIGNRDKDTVNEFKKLFGGDWRFASSMEVGFEKYKVGSIPTIYVLDPNQRIVFKKVGKLSNAKLKDIIDNHL
ncbi:hypothetical protein AKJ41_00570 [candidate division MSBL1 archaeon SCGC-AAA259O05]|uniref:Thioredoxin domain-containing protein n=1 Tax=candidate division MSBL1 archaeon SCGC-AAA259O05 TaxID=1698271 RepID=A0A133V5G3_9EURY|nr:hypothetical protein AKJ41_00570 [candidate division MSBL1 archaeon SCGC-AAA259O05]